MKHFLTLKGARARIPATLGFEPDGAMNASTFAVAALLQEHP